jgi:serine/threonine protein kinase
MAYAHGRGILHRDPKPANVILGPYGEILVVDWGLAKVAGGPVGEPFTADGSLELLRASAGASTEPGSWLGTPAYMSPEQAVGRIDQLGPASDIYSLGATPDHYRRFGAANLLGGALLGQGKYAEAEPLVGGGYRGMKAGEAKIPVHGRYVISEAEESVVRLYKNWGKPDQAAAWASSVGLADLPADVFTPRRAGP